MKYLEVQELPAWPTAYPHGFWCVTSNPTVMYTDPTNPGSYMSINCWTLLRSAPSGGVDVNKLVDQIVALCAKEKT